MLSSTANPYVGVNIPLHLLDVCSVDVPLHSARFYVSKLLSIHFWLPIATALIYYTNEFKAPIDQFPITIQNST